MTIDLFSTHNLNRVVQELNEPASWLLNTQFNNEQLSDTERILFDVETRKNRITPFVAPHVAGKVVNELGFTKKDFAPAYAKDKRIFKPDGALKRTMGEKIGGSLSPAERQAARVRKAIEDQLQMLTTREEVMAAEVLRTGKVTVSGDGFATQVVDFGRDAALTVTLAGNDRWSVTHASSNPLQDYEDWAELVHVKAGARVVGFVHAPDAWAAARARILERGEGPMLFDWLRSGTAQAQMGPFSRGQGNEKARAIGTINDFAMWVYDDIYVDDAGADQHLMPSGTVLAVTASLEGTRCYGVIQDEESGLSSQRYFIKSWLEKDPGVRWLMLQSAPLVVPYRPNASLSAAVL